MAWLSINSVMEEQSVPQPYSRRISIRKGLGVAFTAKNSRYPGAEEGADRERIEKEIKSMPNYFAEYDTTVHFITEEELRRDHGGIPHGGLVLRTGKTGAKGQHNHVIEYSLKLDSNPEFTACVLTAYARAAYRMSREGMSGCKTVFDVAPAYLSPMSPEEMRAHLL